TGFLLLFATLSLFDVWSIMPQSAHRLAAALCAALIIYTLVRKLAKFHVPTPGSVMRRLEAANALPHRPLDVPGQALALGQGDALSEALWRTHSDRAESQLQQLRGFGPRLSLAEVDPRALRVLALLLTIAGAITAGPEAGQRLVRGFALGSGLAMSPSPRL